MTYNNNERNYYHFKIDFYNTDNTEILQTKYYLTKKDIKNELGMSEKTIYNHIYKQVNKGKKYKNLHIYKIREPIINKSFSKEVDDTLILLNIVKKGYEDNNNLKIAF